MTNSSLTRQQPEPLHRITILDTAKGWIAICRCGWVNEPSMFSEDAEQDATAHCKEAST